MTKVFTPLQAAESIRQIRAAKKGQRVLYFSTDPQSGLLMEVRQRTDGKGKLTAQARDADEIAAVAFGLHFLGLAHLTQARWGERGDYRFHYYLTPTREITPTDIKQARSVERLSITEGAA